MQTNSYRLKYLKRSLKWIKKCNKMQCFTRQTGRALVKTIKNAIMAVEIAILEKNKYIKTTNTLHLENYCDNLVKNIENTKDLFNKIKFQRILDFKENLEMVNPDILIN